MKRHIRPRRLVTVVLLVFSWCALWGEVSVANVASGLVLASVTLVLGFGPSLRGRIVVRPLLRFARLVAVDLVVSTLNVAYEVLTPTDRTLESVIAVEVPHETRSHLLLLVVAVTVTPGTAVVDADFESGTLYLHLLDHRRRDEVEEHVRELARLACAGLPVAEPTTDEGARP
jgi:multicomponent Na+:H+ antiporter subunit E